MDEGGGGGLRGMRGVEGVSFGAGGGDLRGGGGRRSLVALEASMLFPSGWAELARLGWW